MSHLAAEDRAHAEKAAMSQHTTDKKTRKRQLGKNLDYYANKFATGNKKPKHQAQSLKHLSIDKLIDMARAAPDREEGYKIYENMIKASDKGYKMKDAIKKTGRKAPDSLYRKAKVVVKSMKKHA
jgi:hypothetical protein